MLDVVSGAPVGRRVDVAQTDAPSGHAVSRTHSSTWSVCVSPLTVSTVAQRGSQTVEAQSAFAVQTHESPQDAVPAEPGQAKRAACPFGPLPKQTVPVLMMSPRSTPAAEKLVALSCSMPPDVLKLALPDALDVSTRMKLPAAAAHGEAAPPSQSPAKLAAVSTMPVPEYVTVPPLFVYFVGIPQNVPW